MNVNAISAFEYITILISIILGLGITQLLTSVAEAFHHQHKVKLYAPHTIWVVLILFLHVQEWFIIYELKAFPVWKLPTFLFIILYPVALFLCAKLVFPLNQTDKTFDLKAYYFASFPRLFYLFATCVLLSLLFNLFFLQAPFAQQVALLIPFTVFIFMALKKPQTGWLHQFIAFLALLLMVTVTVWELNTWYIK